APERRSPPAAPTRTPPRRTREARRRTPVSSRDLAPRRCVRPSPPRDEPVNPVPPASVLLVNHKTRNSRRIGGRPVRRLQPTARALRPAWLVILAAVALAVAPAGCGRAIPPDNGGPAPVRLQSSPLGKYLVDADGHTLYLFERDEGGESYCTGACASVWPPF